jgi:hypothetical protein
MMIKELDLFGVFVPPIFAYAVAAGLIWRILHDALTTLGAYRFVWHPPLFNLSLFVCILGGLVAATFR